MDRSAELPAELDEGPAERSGPLVEQRPAGLVVGADDQLRPQTGNWATGFSSSVRALVRNGSDQSRIASVARDRRGSMSRLPPTARYFFELPDCGSHGNQTLVHVLTACSVQVFIIAFC